MTSRLGRARPVSAGPAAPRAMGRSAWQRLPDAGMVTAEFAVALPAFVLTTVAAVGAVIVVLAQLRCSDAAAIAARMAARGEPTATIRTTALRAAPSGSTLSVQFSGSVVTATVHATVSIPGLARIVPGIGVEASVADPREPSGPEPAP